MRIVAPASTPSRDGVDAAVAVLEGLGLTVELGDHVFDRLGYLAGSDEDRLADFNAALRDERVRAIIAARGGKGAYRIADKLDFAAMRSDPKLVVGFSELTVIHLAIWRHARVPGIHGAAWGEAVFGRRAAQSFQNAVAAREQTIVASSPEEATAALTTRGAAEGVLLGGNLDSIACAAGWALPSLEGAILLIEDVEKWLGHIDRHLTRLINSGALQGVRAIAVGQFIGFKESNGWSIVDVLRDRLGLLNVPILGGLPLGHGAQPVAVPVGVPAVLDCEAGTLTVSPATA